MSGAAAISRAIAVTTVLLLVSNVARADDALLHNPFVHPPLLAAVASSTSDDRSGRWRPDLRATLVSGNVSLVNVAGQLLAVGEEVDGYRLVHISEGQAIFERNGEKVAVLVSGMKGEGND